MAAITRIKIKNFQSHRDTEIEPSPGVNVVVGRNMTGKSALLRALRLLFFNKPGGSDFVSWGARDAEVEIEYGDHKIRRIKGKRNNIYEVDGSEFKSFGKGVPDEVAKVLGMFPIRIADTAYELTIEGPHEPPFLVSETDAVKGKIFAELAKHLLGDLVRLDRAISTANVRLRKMNSETGVLEGEIVSTEEALKQFEPIEGADKKLRMCHDLLTRAQDTQDNLNGLIECRENLRQIDRDLDVCQSFSGVYDLGDLDSQVAEAHKLQLEIVDLTSAKTQLNQIDTSLGKLRSREVVLETMPEYAEVNSLAIELRSLRKVASRLTDVDDAMRQLGHDHSRVATELSGAVNDYGELLLEEKRCPICFGPVDEHDAERIIEELTGNGTM